MNYGRFVIMRFCPGIANDQTQQLVQSSREGVTGIT